MTNGKGLAIGGGLIALAILFSGGSDDETTNVKEIIESEASSASVNQALPSVNRVEKESGEVSFEESKEGIIIEPEPKRITRPSSPTYSCNCSKTCGEMISCNEAYYQLNNCGCARRDGDSDGVPCESICN